MFNAVRAHPQVAGREKLFSFEFGDKSWPKLQAADLVAYEVRQRAMSTLVGNSDTRWQSEALLQRLYTGWVTIFRKQVVR
jgi:hypothetical protein